MDARPHLIAHINLARGFRGGERQTELLVRGLAAAGFAQRLVARAGEPLIGRLAELNGLELRPVPAGAFAASRELGGVALVHAHEARALQAAFIAHVMHGTPYLVTRRVQQGPSHHGLNRIMYRRAARIAVLSGAIGASLRALEPRLEFTVIPSAASGLEVDPARVAAIRRMGQFRVGHVGALVDSHKGQRQIIAVARQLSASHPDIVFFLIGSGRDERALREEAAGLDNLRFIGEVSDVGSWLAALDVFLYPSRHEGLGSVVLDAMAAGLPVVATAVGGIPEMIASGVNGLLCQPDDIAGLTAALLTLHADAGLRERMGEANRRRAEAFSAPAMTRRYIELYRSILPTLSGANPTP
jgi:glycosyltransferase involved in cell wall biosynthesis